MFAVIRHYHFDPKDGAEIDRQIHEEFVPIVKSAKGFVRYYWLDTGDGEGASVSVFKDKAGADESESAEEASAAPESEESDESEEPDEPKES